MLGLVVLYPTLMEQVRRQIVDSNNYTSLLGHSIDGFTDPKGPSFTAFSYNFFMANPMIAKLEHRHHPELLWNYNREVCHALSESKVCVARWYDVHLPNSSEQ